MTFEPVVSSDLSPQELSVKAVLTACIISMILSAANAYINLFTGLTLAVSIPASIISMILLKPLKANILEINCVQTGVAAGSCSVAGINYTIPALLMLSAGAWQNIHYGETLCLALVGSVLGVLWALIVENTANLRYPEGVAIAEVMKVTCLIPKAEVTEIQEFDVPEPLSTDTISNIIKPETQTTERSSRQYIIATCLGIAVGLLIKLFASGVMLWNESFSSASFMFGTVFYFGFLLSPSLISIGYISKIKVASVMTLGGLLSSCVAIPILAANYDRAGKTALQVSNQVFSKQVRYVGVGAMLLGGVLTFLLLSKSLFVAVRSNIHAFRTLLKEGLSNVKRTERDIPMPLILIGVGVCTVPLFILMLFMCELNIFLAMGVTLFTIIFSFIFSAVTGYISGLVGSSQSPVSGVTVATVLCASTVLMLILGRGSSLGPKLSILIGSVISVSAAIGGDNMQDLKCGYLVGGTPWKVQMMQIIGTIGPNIFVPLILTLLISAYGIGDNISEQHPNPLPAPQSTLMAAVANAMFFGSLPLELVGIGMICALVVMVLNTVVFEWLLSKYTDFRLPVLAIALGSYLPWDLTTPIFLGSLIGWVAEQIALKRILIPILARHETNSKLVEDGKQRGLLFCAGIITGEALMGVLLAVPIVIAQRRDVLALFGSFDIVWPGVLLCTSVCVLLFIAITEGIFSRVLAHRIK